MKSIFQEPITNISQILNEFFIESIFILISQYSIYFDSY